MTLSERDQLFTENLGLAKSIARKFAGRGKDASDAEQEASLALWEATRTFRPDINPCVPFGKWAGTCISSSLQKLKVAESRQRLDATNEIDLELVPDPDVEGRRNDLVDAMWSSFRSLDTIEAEVVSLVAGLNDDTKPLTMEQTAVELKIPLRTAERLYRSAKLKIKRDLLSGGFRVRDLEWEDILRGKSETLVA
jgi:RNA polymerase sigma factor (sigma-70 family)